MEIGEAIKANGDQYLQERVKKAVDLISRSIELYGLDGMAFSFNGGKDSTVLLHLTRLAVAVYCQEHNIDLTDKGALGGIYTFFYDHGTDFQDLYDFVRETDMKYGLQTETITLPYKEGLEHIIGMRPVKGILLGTRRGDPNAGDQEHFSPSTKGWPPFMRINPALEWTYHEVWNFLLATGVSYCKLYDQGYTSIGSTTTTVPNDLLRREDGTFAHARFLADARQERAGRIKKASSLRPTGSVALTRSCGILVIGDELLGGKVDDTNSHFLARKLREMGWKLRKVIVAPDDMNSIASSARSLSDTHEVVISSGGIGPTVDDITMHAIAQAFNLPVTRNPELERRLRHYFGDETTEYHLKMAEAPDHWDVEILDCGELDGKNGVVANPFPVIRVKNIYILPGVPKLLERKWWHVAQHIGHLAPFLTATLRLGLTDETKIASPVKIIAAEMGSNVSVGSYPVEMQEDGTGVVVCLESKDGMLLDTAHRRLAEMLAPLGCILSEESDVSTCSRVSNTVGKLEEEI
mmetsp:Transcript_32757/g.92930  ORF Transcript_32757/g.92930 Transcript_32757/m.92930 type:complete len:522 (+) Transcript_32757:246-1811(+)